MKNEIDSWLKRLEIAKMNPMQEAVLEKAERKIRLIAPTGSGKTLAFLLYALQGMDRSQTGRIQTLILVPTRELAQQIEQQFRQMQTGIKVTSCYGGRKRELEENALLEPPGLLIGTPGRLDDHIRRQHLDLQHLDALILDEFDKTIEAGFEEEMQFILESSQSASRYLLTSATDSQDLPAFLPPASMFLTLSFSHQNEGKAHRLEIQWCRSAEKDKADRLFALICHLGARPTIVFCHHRESVERLWSILKSKGLTPVYYHGSMEQRDRDLALAKFKNGSSNLLITTDLAARGIDISFIRYIIHYHLPYNEQSFIHRNGRTARMEASGTAILMLSLEETLPPYVDENISEIVPSPEAPLPAKPKWVTLYLGAGRRDKINRGDILGFLTKKGLLRSEDVGIIEVRDQTAFVAIRRSQMASLLPRIQNEKIKNRKVKIDLLKT